MVAGLALLLIRSAPDAGIGRLVSGRLMQVAKPSATPPVNGPILPAGCSSEFQSAVLAVEASLQTGDFATASARLQLLPKTNFTYVWDDSKAPVTSREAFADALKRAIQAWSDIVHPVRLTTGGAPDVRLGFETTLAPAPNTNVPAGTASIVSPNSFPRLETILGLKRGAAQSPATPIDIQNSLNQAIGTYLGLARTPVPGTFMGNNVEPAVSVSKRTNSEYQIATENLAVVDVLRKAVHEHTRLVPVSASAFLDPDPLTFGPVLQGAQVHIPLQVTNNGSGPLSILMIPDCGCVTTGPTELVPPGDSRLADITVDTTEYSYTIHHQVLVLTNDPNQPTRLIPLEVKIEPRYRFIVPGGDTQLVEGSGADVEIYLDIAPSAGILVRDVAWQGVDGKAQIEPWSGMLADEEHGEAPRMRQGYRFKVHVKGNIVAGRPAGTLIVTTTNRDFPELRSTIYFQKGIVSFPAAVNLGQMSKSKTGTAVISRAGKPFRIVAATVNPNSLHVTYNKIAGSEDYRVAVTYTGKAQAGDFLGVVHLYTDDPRQPRVDVAVTGNVE